MDSPTRTRAERRAAERRRRRRMRLGAAAAAAAAAVLVVIVFGTLGGSAEKDVVERYAKAWEAGDYGTMYSLISEGDRERTPRAAFEAAYRDAAATATARRIEVGDVEEPEDGEATLDVAARTRMFRVVEGEVVLPLDGEGDDTRVDWAPHVTFPGVRPGERLTRRSELPPRARIVARDGEPLPDIPGAADIIGELGPPPAPRRKALYAAGYPPGAQVGLTGLQRAFEPEVAGTPGGVLRAGRRVIARSRPRKARPVRASIDPRLQGAAVNALGGQLGGVAALDPKTGEVLALAGIAFSTLQPPGSAMKVITITAAFEARMVNFGSEFPVQTSGNVGGQIIANAGGEACGGDLEEVFAESCNSVFGPMGVELGEKRLVDAAERFGFNEAPGIPGAVASTIPRNMVSDAEVGSSAIGQGRVQATPLQMAEMAATIGNDGVRAKPTLMVGRRPRTVRVTTRRIAAKVEKLMIGVVRFGTGENAAIPGVKVAGKTGTAELGGGLSDDAWFASYAPTRRPKVAVGVLVVQAGFGGDVAAPIARQVMQAALGR